MGLKLNVYVKKCSNESTNVNDDSGEKRTIVDGDIISDDMETQNADDVNKKRKRESYEAMLDWIRWVAKDPMSPAVNSLPEMTTWNHYGDDNRWKQILMIREAMILRKNIIPSTQQPILQKKHRAHPTMYDDDPLRYSQRLLVSKDPSRKEQERRSTDSSSSGSLSDDCATADSNSCLKRRRKKKTRVGLPYQVDLPEFSGADYRSDSKWLGTKAWPLDKGEYNVTLIERDPVGKGRQESCGCQFPSSLECVAFHVREKRTKMKLELGPAFYGWKFNDMGEFAALIWTEKDENKFRNIVQSNPLSAQKHFWNELFKVFPKKGREALVSYYFNVFLLRRRALQNRSSTVDIKSDDEYSEFGPVGNQFGRSTPITPGSIFCSPKKTY